MSRFLQTTEPGADGLVIQRSEHWGYNAIAVVSGNEAVVIDPGLTPKELASLRAEVERGGRRVTALVLTHSHHDHIRGWRAFGEVPIVAPYVVSEKSEDARQRILAGKAKFDTRSGIDDPDFAYPEVTETFGEAGESGALRVGGIELQLVFLPGHSNCTSVVVIPALGAMLTADYLVHPGLPYCRWETRAFEAAQERLLELVHAHGITRAIPAHNNVLEGRPEIERALRAELSYFGDLRAEIERRLKAGENHDRLIRDMGPWLGERRGKDLGPVARQDTDNARRVLAELIT